MFALASASPTKFAALFYYFMLCNFQLYSASKTHNFNCLALILRQKSLTLACSYRFWLVTDSSSNRPSARDQLKEIGPWCRRKANNMFRKKILFKRIPILSWLPKYSSEDAVGDIVAGVTVGLTVIPQALAYSGIAGLPPAVSSYKVKQFVQFREIRRLGQETVCVPLCLIEWHLSERYNLLHNISKTNWIEKKIYIHEIVFQSRQILKALVLISLKLLISISSRSSQ